MRSPRAEARHAVRRAALLVVLAGSVAGLVHAQDAATESPFGASPPSSGASSASDPRAARIETSVDELRRDPLLSGRHKTHTLRWRHNDPDTKPDPADASLLAWFAALARFINDTSRFLLWGMAVVLVALLLVSARHLVHLRGLRRRMKAAAAVSHVRDLDVRPESLPDDVGAAAWALWQAGQVPAALSLLYRGALSRLIHKFSVPITSSATEGECLDLARERIQPGALRYVTQVVRAWEASIYGGRTLSTSMGEALCSGFAQRLDAAIAVAERPA